MSGGSYNYLCSRDGDELLAAGAQGDLAAMADRLAGLGYAADAARETTEALLVARQAVVRLQAIRDRLQPVWRAVEWWDSCDSGEDAVKNALASYRGEPTP